MAEWVVQTRGKNRGRIGIEVPDVSFEACGMRILCRFGSDGPSVWLRPGSIRKATQTEIAKFMGCRPSDLPDYLKKAHPA